MIKDISTFGRNLQNGVLDIRWWKLGSSMELSDKSLFMIRFDELGKKQEYQSSTRCD